MADDQKLKIEDVKVGSGEAVKEGDHVVIHYTGWLEETQDRANQVKNLTALMIENSHLKHQLASDMSLKVGIWVLLV